MAGSSSREGPDGFHIQDDDRRGASPGERGSGRLVRWWRRRSERVRRTAERRELLALGDGCWRDLGIGRADEEARKPDRCP